MQRTFLLLALSAALACSCRASGDGAGSRGASANAGSAASPIQNEASAVEPVFAITEVASFKEPWALAFLPDGRLLVTEKRGALRLLDVNSRHAENIGGVPVVAYGGQGGFGDVILHPGFAQNQLVYVSFAEPGEGGSSGAGLAWTRAWCKDRGRCD